MSCLLLYGWLENCGGWRWRVEKRGKGALFSVSAINLNFSKYPFTC